MPPSPAVRYSPGRELRGDNHKRGRSLESGILSRERDEDLALFNEVQSKERDNFLLQSNDDFEDTFTSKLRYFSDYKLGISIPVRGESSDLLNAEGDKNDYDWLLTPPDTPLFPSLEDEDPPVNNLAQRGRPRTQPISISRSSTMEKSHRSSRGSASPNRLSPSPRSGNGAFQPRGRSSTAPSSSPPATGRHAAASRRPSPPSSKPSTPALQSSTPTPRRLSTGSSGTTTSSSGARGTSPIKASRGNSASPKIRAWQSNIPGFSTEAPPNLRTSLADRPASYVRGSSPASRNGKDSSVKSGRQSMSPTASRSISSYHSHDRDQFSSHSKGSVASSGDDDMESLQSSTVGISERTSSRRVGGFTNNKASFPKKTNRTVSSSSAPKRSFDLALRQMDHRKSPQNMFRPLLSSVPSSTFYAGKASAAHHAMISRNSSVTTSSNASSDLGTSCIRDNEGDELNQEDVTSGYVKIPDDDVEDDLFVFDKTDASGIEHEAQNQLPDNRLDDLDGGLMLHTQLDGSENLSDHDTATVVALEDTAHLPEVDGLIYTFVCSRCGCSYSSCESVEVELKLCPECHESYSTLRILTPVTNSTIAENSTVAVKEQESLKEFGPGMVMIESSELAGTGEEKSGQHEDLVRNAHGTYSEPIWKFLAENSPSQLLSDESEHGHVNHEVISPPTGSSVLENDAGSERLQQASDIPNLKVDVLEGTGISILLKRSSSSKGHVIQSRNFSASSISYDDLSFVRGSTNSMRSSVGHGSLSTSSSVDFGSSKQVETRFQRQLSSRKSDIENYKHDINAKHRRSGSSLSGTSSHVGRDIVYIERDLADTTCTSPREQLLASEDKEADITFMSIENNNGETEITSSRESSGQAPVNLGNNSLTSSSNFEEPVSYENVEDLTNDTNNTWDVEASAIAVEAYTVEEAVILNSCVDSIDVGEVPSRSSLDAISEGETENTCQDSHDLQHDATSQSSESSLDELGEHSESDMDVSDSMKEGDASDHAAGILEESTIVVGDQGAEARSLSLEEAADEAASNTIEKENTIPSEISWPLIPAVGKNSSYKKELLNGRANKHSSQKAPKQKRVETSPKPPSSPSIADKFDTPTKTRIVGAPKYSETMKPPKLESKCNCTIM